MDPTFIRRFLQLVTYYYLVIIAVYSLLVVSCYLCLSRRRPMFDFTTGSHSNSCTALINFVKFQLLALLILYYYLLVNLDCIIVLSRIY